MLSPFLAVVCASAQSCDSLRFSLLHLHTEYESVWLVGYAAFIQRLVCGHTVPSSEVLSDKLLS